MEGIAHQTLVTLTDALLELGEVDLEGLPLAILRAIAQLIPGDLVQIDALDPITGAVLWFHSSNPHDPRVHAELFNEFIHQHPTLSPPANLLSRPFTAGRWSDFTTLRQFRNTALHNEVYRYMDANYQVGLVFPASPRVVVGLSVNRKRSDFSSEERLLLELLARHASRVYRHAEDRARLEEALNLREMALGKDATMLVAACETILFANERALRLLRNHFGSHSGAVLPAEIRRWLTKGGATAHALVRRSAGRELIVEAHGPVVTEKSPSFFDDFGGETTMAIHVLKLRESAAAPTATSLKTLGLTPRESEVLGWLAQGKRSSEIAIIIGSRPRTVDKHVENIIEKLGVETRMAAVALAWHHLKEAP